VPCIDAYFRYIELQNSFDISETQEPPHKKAYANAQPECRDLIVAAPGKAGRACRLRRKISAPR